jgi:hypothetical protein
MMRCHGAVKDLERAENRHPKESLNYSQFEFPPTF